MLLKEILNKVLIKEGVSSLGLGWLWTQLYKNPNNLDISIYKTRSNNINKSHSYRVVVPGVAYQPPYAVIEFNNSDFLRKIWNTKNKNAKRWLVNNFESFENFERLLVDFTVVLCNENSSSEAGHYDLYSGGNGIHAVAGYRNQLAQALAEFGNLNKQYSEDVQIKNINKLLLNLSAMTTAVHEFQHFIQNHVYTKSMSSHVDVKNNVPNTVVNIFKIACYVCEVEGVFKNVNSEFFYNRTHDQNNKLNLYFPRNSINIFNVFEKLKQLYLTGYITKSQLYSQLNGLQILADENTKGFRNFLRAFKSPNKSALTKKNQKLLENICKDHYIKLNKVENTSSNDDIYMIQLPFSKTESIKVHPFDRLGGNINDDKPWEELKTELDAELVSNLHTVLVDLDKEYHIYVYFSQPKQLAQCLKQNLRKELSMFNKDFINRNHKQFDKLQRISTFIVEKGIEVNDQITIPSWLPEILAKIKLNQLKIKYNNLYIDEKQNILHEKNKEFKRWQQEYWNLLLTKVFDR